MRRTATAFLGVLILTCLTGLAQATIYPPGPGGACPDTLTISEIQSALNGTPISACVPALSDSVRGVKGIIIGVDPHATGFAIYMQESTSDPWTGIDVFTGGNNLFVDLGLALGDEIAVYGHLEVFSNEDEITADDGAFGTNLIIRKISSGNPLPPFKVLTASEAKFDAAAEEWEGMLTKVNGPLRVARNTGIGTRLFALVDNNACPEGSAGPCDSVVVDGNTMSNPRFDAPANGTLVSSVQGVFNQRTGNQSGSGYRTQLRDGNDIEVAAPPNLSDAYPVHLDTIRVVFDRDVATLSAEDENNYQLASFGTVNSATLVESNVVHLAVSNGLLVGDNEGVTVNGIVGLTSGLPMTVQQTSSFHNGVLNITDIQAPDPDSLTMSSLGCEDRSFYSGAGTGGGQRLTFRAVAVARYGSLYYMQDATSGGAPRSGLAIFAPIAPLTLGNQYMFVGAMQEFFGETEGVFNQYLRDEGAAVIAPATTKDLSVLLDVSCDATQSVDSGDDYEGQLMRLVDVYVRSDAAPGSGFFVTKIGGSFADSINVRDRSNSIVAFDAELGHEVEVIGILGQFGGVYDIDPRNDADIIDLGLVADAPNSLPGQIRFAVYPNPARRANVSLGLPKAAVVDLGVFDLQGRRMATLASGSLGAGEHSFEWNGRTAGGKRVVSGVYFYKLKVGEVSRSLRGVLID